MNYIYNLDLIVLNKDYNLDIITSNQESTTKMCLENNNVHEFNNILGYESHMSKIEKFKSILNDNNLSSDECLFIIDILVKV